MKFVKNIIFLIAIFAVIFSCSVNRKTVSQENAAQLPDSLINWSDSIAIRALDSIQDSIIFYSVREFRSKLTSRLKKSGNAAMAIAELEELEKKEYYAHSRIDTFKGTLFERVPNVTLKPSPEIYSWFYIENKAGVLIPRNGDTEYKIVSEITNRLGETKGIDGEVTIFTELPPCNSCSHAIYVFNKKYPLLDIEVLYSPYGRLIPPKKK